MLEHIDQAIVETWLTDPEVAAEVGRLDARAAAAGAERGRGTVVGADLCPSAETAARVAFARQLEHWRREGRLVAVTVHGRARYPAFQFDSDGRPRPVVGHVISLLAPAFDERSIVLWFVRPHPYLEARTPLEALVDDPARVAIAAELSAARRRVAR